MTLPKTRPFGITALSILFVFGTASSFVAAVSLSFPDSFLEPIWRLNPQAHQGFLRIGGWAIWLMTVVCGTCACAAIGLWRSRRWGYWVGVVMLIANLLGDLINAIAGIEPRAIVGVPIAALILIYLARAQTRSFFK
jgi:hypothetical protein